MKDTCKLSEFRSFRGARPFAVTLLFALTLAGPRWLWGQCGSQPSNSQVTSVTVSV